MNRTVAIIALIGLMLAAFTTAQTGPPASQPQVYLVTSPGEDGAPMERIEGLVVNADDIQQIKERQDRIEAKLDDLLDANDPTRDLREVTDWRIIAGQIDGFGPSRSQVVLDNFRVFEPTE